MKHKSTARLCSIAAALMLCANAAGIPFSGTFLRSMPVHAEAAFDEPVTMCVLLEGGALPDLTTDALTDDAHAEMIRCREEVQDDIFSKILALYPESYMRYRYTALLNGFSCVMPESLADAVRAIPGVTDVSKCSEIRLTPCMATAAELGDIPSYRQETGCTGEGQVICIMDSELDTTHPMFAALPDNIQTKLKKEDVQKIAQTVGFHVNADPDKLYLSSKIPFAADYISDDPYAVRNTNQNYYHGTHVSGIAAGNAITDAAGNQISGIAKDAQIVFMPVGENMDRMACVNDGETRIEFDDVTDLDGFECEPADHAVRLVQNVVGGKAMEIGGKVDPFVWISAAAPDTGLFAIVVYIIFKRMPSGGQLGDIACILEDFVFAVAQPQIQMMDGMSFRQKYAELDTGGREDGQFCVRVGVIAGEAKFQKRSDGLFPFDSVLGLPVNLHDFGGLLPFLRSVKFDVDGQCAEIGNGRERIVIRMEVI